MEGCMMQPLTVESLIRRAIVQLPTLDPEQVPLEDSCPICLLSFASIMEGPAQNEGELEIAHKAVDLRGVTKLEHCGHVFCRQDLIEWIRGGHGTCPACRHAFAPIAFNFMENDAESSDGDYVPGDEEEDDDESEDGSTELDVDIDIEFDVDMNIPVAPVGIHIEEWSQGVSRASTAAGVEDYVSHLSDISYATWPHPSSIRRMPSDRHDAVSDSADVATEIWEDSRSEWDTHATRSEEEEFFESNDLGLFDGGNSL